MKKEEDKIVCSPPVQTSKESPKDIHSGINLTSDFRESSPLKKRKEPPKYEISSDDDILTFTSFMTSTPKILSSPIDFSYDSYELSSSSSITTSQQLVQSLASGHRTNSSEGTQNVLQNSPFLISSQFVRETQVSPLLEESPPTSTALQLSPFSEEEDTLDFTQITTKSPEV